MNGDYDVKDLYMCIVIPGWRVEKTFEGSRLVWPKGLTSKEKLKWKMWS
jgi:hypothetical protein